MEMIQNATSSIAYIRINERTELTSHRKKIFNRTYCTYLKGVCSGEKPDEDPTYFTLSPVKMTGPSIKHKTSTTTGYFLTQHI